MRYIGSEFYIIVRFYSSLKIKFSCAHVLGLAMKRQGCGVFKFNFFIFKIHLFICAANQINMRVPVSGHSTLYIYNNYLFLSLSLLLLCVIIISSKYKMAGLVQYALTAKRCKKGISCVPRGRTSTRTVDSKK